MKIVIYSLVVIFYVQLSGCAMLSGSRATQEKSVFFFDIPLKPLDLKADSNIQISVSIPKAALHLNNHYFHYQHHAQRLAHYAHNRWLDKPAHLLQPLLVNQLESSGYFQAVLLGSQSPLRTRYRLDTELLHLHQDFTQTDNRLKLSIRSQLFDLQTKSIIGTFLFQEQQLTVSHNAIGGAAAANLAVSKWLKAVQVFVLASVKSAKGKM